MVIENFMGQRKKLYFANNLSHFNYFFILSFTIPLRVGSGTKLPIRTEKMADGGRGRFVWNKTRNKIGFGGWFCKDEGFWSDESGRVSSDIRIGPTFFRAQIVWTLRPEMYPKVSRIALSHDFDENNRKIRFSLRNRFSLTKKRWKKISYEIYYTNYCEWNAKSGEKRIRHRKAISKRKFEKREKWAKVQITWLYP